MIYSVERNFLFVHIHKCGGTSLVKSYVPHKLLSDVVIGGYKFGELMQPHYKKEFGLQKHSTYQQIEEVLGADRMSTLNSFAFVRNPYERVRSLYTYSLRMIKNKEFENAKRDHTWPRIKRAIRQKDLSELTGSGNQTQKKQRNIAIKWPAVKAALQSKNFSEFIRQELVWQKDIALRPYSQFLYSQDSGGQPKHLIRIEEVNQQIGLVREIMGTHIEIGRHNTSKGFSIDEISKEDMAYLRERLKGDLELYESCGKP